MSAVRRQAQIDAPIQSVWNLVGDPNRHPEWFPKVVEAECDGLDERCTYRMVVQGPMGIEEETVLIERLEGCGEITIRCLDNGTYMCWKLMSAQDGTFVDAEFGMEPLALPHKVFDRLAGRRYYRRWLEQSLDGLRDAAESEAATT